ncbi:MAG: hypothetical protein J6P48_01360 [Oscillospiraceae bacterium]|nr:hypothetical protein [Oscillospiraceae bacterium]
MHNHNPHGALSDEAPDRRKTVRLLLIVTLVFVVLSAAVFAGAQGVLHLRLKRLEQALESKDPVAAERILAKFERDEATEAYFLRCEYLTAEKLFEEGLYKEAAAAFSALGNYPGADEQHRKSLYSLATALMQEGLYEEAETLYEEAAPYKDAGYQAEEACYQRACSEADTGDRILAFQLFLRLGEHADSAEKAKDLAVSISGSADIDAALAVIEGLSEEDLAHRRILLQSRNSLKGGIVAAGSFHTVGLCSDGTVIACGDNSFGQCETQDWQHITSVAAGAYHTLGLCTDGRVIACGRGNESQCDTSEWTDIVAIAAADYASFGLRSDGSVLVSGFNDYPDIPGWSHVIAIRGGTYNAAALTASGDALVTHVTARSDRLSSLVDLAVTTAFAAGLKADGTVVCSDGTDLGWHDIVAISAGSTSLLALDTSGRILAYFFRPGDAIDLSTVENCISFSPGGTHFVFARTDGSVIALGENSCGQCDTQAWNLF